VSPALLHVAGLIDHQHRPVIVQMLHHVAALHSGSRLPGGQFTVRAEIHPGDYVWIEVEDNGGPWLEAALIPAGATASISSVPSLVTGASKVTTSPGLSGCASTGTRACSPGPSDME
jgi:hypothetical protein